MKSHKLFLGISLAILCLGIALLIWGLTQAKKAVILIEWSTASELDTVGFNLYRSDNSDGPFEQVNASLVPSSSDPLTGGEYKYEDTTVTAGKTYFYRLEDVETNGASTQHGPIEVKAESEGKPSLISGGMLIAFSLIGMIVLFLPSKKSPTIDDES